MNITDIQNYMFSFFGGVYFPPTDLDELKEHYDVVVFGHIHLLTDEEKDGTRFVNPGSVSIPRNDNSRNYLIIDQDKFEIKNLLTSEVVDSFTI